MHAADGDDDDDDDDDDDERLRHDWHDALCCVEVGVLLCGGLWESAVVLSAGLSEGRDLTRVLLQARTGSYSRGSCWRIYICG